MPSDQKLQTIASIKAANAAGADAAESQQIAREALIASINNALEFARISQRSVGLLMVHLIRPDKLDAMVGAPSTELMKHALLRLHGALRAADRYTAVSEEKIIFLLPNLKSTSQAILAADKIQRLLEEGFLIGESTVAIRPVIGIVLFPDHGEIAEELVVHADIAAGVAVSHDFAQHIFQNEDRGDSDVYLGLEAPLREAIRTNRIQLHYQPQVDLKSGKCVAVEALVRWDAPDYGPVPAATIIRVAELSGVIGALTHWVINTAFRQQTEWKKLGIDVNISVNLSTISLANSELPEQIQQAIGTWGVDPKCITFEITENATISDTERSIAVLNRLKALGVKIALDDFGTGYSSLSYVKNFPLDELKIDRLFVQNICDSPADQKIVRSIVALAHSFNLQVVAEGVEDDARLRELKKLGCDLVQGYVFSPALPASHFANWMRARP